jgi:hypothetical protein
MKIYSKCTIFVKALVSNAKLCTWQQKCEWCLIEVCSNLTIRMLP